MKELIHAQNQGGISFLNVGVFTGKVIKGVFFEDKPVVADLFMSHAFRTTNHMKIFEVVDIVTNRNAKIHSDCKRNPKNAYFELKVKDVSDDERYADIDCSIGRLATIHSS